MEHLIVLLQFLGGIALFLAYALALFSAYALILFITGFALAANASQEIDYRVDTSSVVIEIFTWTQ